MKSLDVWNNNMLKDIEKLDNKLEVYDNWLDKFSIIIDNNNDIIIDLGCGIGNDTLYLLNKDKAVLSCDFSDKALDILKANIPSANIMQFDISKDFPINKNSTSLVIANLSLHYFDKDTTFRVIENISKILTLDGFMIFRVNSINDKNYGAEDNLEIGYHYFSCDGINKRFFCREDIYYFFKEWDIVYLKEIQIITKIHNLPKVAWEVLVKKNS